MVGAYLWVYHAIFSTMEYEVDWLRHACVAFFETFLRSAPIVEAQRSNQNETRHAHDMHVARRRCSAAG